MDLPKIIDSPEFKVIFLEKITRFTERCKATISPDFEAPTPADPSWHILTELSLCELIIKEKVNAAAYVQLIKLSNDLEFIFGGRIRPGESYEAYRDRMRGRKYEASPAGTPAMYKALSFLYGEATVNGRPASVEDCSIQNVGGDLLINLLINSDAPDLKAAVINQLTEAFKSEQVKPALDVVTFRAALTTPLTISGTLALLPGFSADYKATIEKTFREKFEAQKKLGWAPSVSWISKELHQTGVRSVILRSPVSNIPVQPERYPVISSLDLTVEVAA